MDFLYRLRLVSEAIQSLPREDKLALGFAVDDAKPDTAPVAIVAAAPERLTIDKFKQGTPLERVAAKIYEAEPDGKANVQQRAAIIDDWNKTTKRPSDKIRRDQRDSVTSTVSKIRKTLNPNRKPNSAK